LSDAPAVSLADQALSRLRKLADGNGIVPEKITLTKVEEDIYTIEGTLGLVPKNDVQKTRYPGGARGGKNRKILPDMAALQTEIQHIHEEMQKGDKWIQDCIKELKTAPGEGWGLEGAHVTIADTSVILAASETCQACHGVRLLTCAQCNGQGSNICTHCGGAKIETCPMCNGSGHNPSQPDQLCAGCGGSRTAPCRFCHGSGQLVCPTCHGRKGVPCSVCKGTGQITEEVALTCGAETHFKISGQNLPSGLRRGLDRLGIANLVKGYADIETLPPQTEEEPRENVHDHARNKNFVVALSYRAKLPYADLRISFNGYKATINAFGKRCALLGVPSFLDDALEHWRVKLKQATRGEVVLDAALEGRAIHEALELELIGKGQIKELRKKYPVGMSQDVAKEILLNIRLALNRFTLRVRSLVAVICGVLATIIFSGIVLTPLHADLIGRSSKITTTLFDILLPVAVITASWFALSAAVRFTLQRRFRNLTISLNQKTGKTGYVMVIAITVLYFIIYVMAHLR